MFEQRKNIRSSNSITQIKEAYRDHPCMAGVEALKEQLQQEKIQHKAFCQSVKQKRTVR